MTHRLYHYAELGSTNDEAKRLAALGEPEGTLVVAFGPPDDDTWEPCDLEALERTWKSWPEPFCGAAPGPMVNFHPKSARNGVNREPSQFLREALGCPFRP